MENEESGHDGFRILVGRVLEDYDDVFAALAAEDHEVRVGEAPEFKEES